MSGRTTHSRAETGRGSAPGLPSDLLPALKRAGLRLTRARRVAVEILSSAPRPLTIQQLHETVIRAVRCDLSTIYRLVHDLVGLKLARAVHLPGRTVPAYVAQPPQTSQDLVTCEGCGSVTFLKTPPELIELERRLAEELHFHNLRHQLGITGCCEPCRDKGGTSGARGGARPRRASGKKGVTA